MSLKSELLKFLVRVPNTQTVPQRKALLTAVGFDRLNRQILWEGSSFVFFNELLDLLFSEGYNEIDRFLKNLADRDLGLVGLEDSVKIITFAERIADKGLSDIDVLPPDDWSLNFDEVFNPKTSSYVPFDLPQSDTPHFTGREYEIQQLETLLLNPQGSKICSIVGVSGGGGIGKSALACHFATIHRDKFPDGIIGLRVDGKDVDTIAREFVRRCREELDSEDNEWDAIDRMKKICANRQMLLIFDNAEDAIVDRLRPNSSRCAVIVTTRRRDLPFQLNIGERETIDLPPLPEADALKLLKKILGSERVETALAATKQLVKLVGNLPLALQVLGAGLRGRRDHLDDYTKALEAEKGELFEELKVADNRDLNVEASINLSLKYLSDDEVNFFACLSVCAAEGFSKQTAMAATGCDRNLEIQRRLKRLYDLSLLNYVDTGENRFVLHPLVREYAEGLARKRGLLTISQQRHANFFVDWLESADVENAIVVSELAANLDDVIIAAQWFQVHETDTEASKNTIYQFASKLSPLFEQYGYWQKAITLTIQFQSLAEKFQDWSTLVKYKIHEARYRSFVGEFELSEAIINSAQTDLHKIEDLDEYKRRKSKLLNVLAGIFQKQGKNSEAIQIFQHQIICDQEIGGNKSLGITFNRLGKLLQSQGKFEEAKNFFERGIEINEIINEQFSIAIGLNCLGGLLQQQGKLSEAQHIFEREVKIDESLNDQLKLARTLNRLGIILQQLNELKESQQVFERQIAISKSQNDQLQIAVGLNCLGIVLQQRGKLEESQQAFEQQISISQSFVDRTQLSIGLNCLGRLLQQQGRLEEAEPIFERLIIILEALDDKSRLVITLNRLGRLLQQQDKIEEAQKLFEREIEIAEALDDKSRLAIALNRLGRLLQQQDKIEEAQKLFEREIEIAEALDDKSRLAIALNRLGRLLQQQDKIEKAQKLFERGIEIAENLDNKSQLATALNLLGQLLQQQGKIKESQNIFEREIEIANYLNDRSSRYAWTLHNLGRIFKTKGDFEEAVILLKQSQDIFENEKDLQGLAKVMNTLGGVLTQLGKWDEAENILRQSYDLALELEDKRGEAIIANSLGQVKANQDGKQNFELAQMYFRQSIKLGKELGDREHPTFY